MKNQIKSNQIKSNQIKYIFLFACLILLKMPNGFAQRCGTKEPNKANLQKNNPTAYQEWQRLENFTRTYANRRTKEETTIFIPVVVHILHNGEAEGTGKNLSVAQIQSQIDVLNEDFTRTNGDRGNTPAPFQSVAGTPNIQFHLACIDPNGQPTNGITRTRTNVVNFLDGDNPDFNAIKNSISGGRDPWATARYLNIWVSDIVGLLGYATFPHEFQSNPNLDGVVIDFDAFGRTGTLKPRYNLGRTATHEVGHWLNVYHTFHDGCNDSDVRPSDMPKQSNFNTGRPTFPRFSCKDQPNGDMFMNYMDYTDDVEMNLFSVGQMLRMRAMFQPGMPRANMGRLVGITGNDILCSSSVYQFPDVSFSGAITWTTNRPDLIRISNINGRSVTLTPTNPNAVAIAELAGRARICNNSIVTFTTMITVGNVPPSDIHNFYYNGQEFGGNTDYEFSVVDLDPRQYEWSVNGGTITSGQNAPTTKIRTYPGSSSPYYRHYFDLEVKAFRTGCGWTLPLRRSGYLIGGETVAEIVIFPNPANDVLSVLITPEEASNSIITIEKFTIELLNQAGVVLRTANSTLSELKGQLATMPVSDIPEGTYILNIIQGNEVKSEQIVIERQ